MVAVDTRARSIGTVLEEIVSWNHLLGGTRRAPFAGTRLTRSQLDALFLIAHGAKPSTPGSLADRLGLTRGAVTQLVEELLAEGLVSRTRRPDDARSWMLRLTDHARREIDAFEASMIERLAPRFAWLDDGELETLADLLQRVGGEREQGDSAAEAERTAEGGQR
ncbi:MarR family winged helix-turn-helix transcriptional regulator [Rathayibacter sp. CAU 1779]